MLGGWYSYTGANGKGAGRTLLRISACEMLDYEDLVESTEGYYPK